ncbi:MAG: SpoIIE family protein phosphatase [Ruminococcus sp.]|nr:SpoIIE family protein phosphatase [Ruminococcus sp.]
MKKLFGLTIGGLQNKIINLVLFFMLAIVIASTLLTVFKAMELNKTVNDAREQQTASIESISKLTMNTMLNQTASSSIAQQAQINDALFSNVKTDVLILKDLAERTFAQKDELADAPYSLPDASLEGNYCAQVLTEEGVDYKSSKLLGTAAHMSDMMISMCKNSDYMYNCYIGLSDGTFYMVDPDPQTKYDENGKPKPIAVRQRPWYTNAAESGHLSFSGVIRDTYNDAFCVTCSAPVIVDGTLYGVVAIDVFLTSMEQYVEQSNSGSGFICIINDKGQVIFAPKNNGVFYADTEENAEDLRKSNDTVLATFITQALSARTNIQLIEIRGKEYYLTGAPMETVGWTVISVVSKDAVDSPTNSMLDEYEKINDEASQSYNDSNKHMNKITIVSILAIIIIGALMARYTAGKIVKPIESMTEEIDIGAKTGKLFEMKPIYETNDEIEVLAKAFDDLSKKTKQYIEHITQITKEKERIGTELELARKIQSDMLPNIYPAFPDREEFDIYATMHPAKEVGGDFYDFFLIDDDHLGIVMADVSGKGIPAALFMMMSKILINNFAMAGDSPAKVLEQTNAVICQNNEEEMFVTVWFGVLEISTGKITAANAGHEYPIVKKPDGEFEIFKDKHGFVIGGMDGMKYKEYEFTLEKGGVLYLYTDGIPEATDSNDELFGTERLIETMNSHFSGKVNVVDLLDTIKSSVDEFVGDADQFDDMTMLGLTLNP